MDNGLSLISLLTLLGAAHGLFLALALINTQKGDHRAHLILAIFTLVFALDLAEEFLYQTGFFRTTPNLLHVIAPIDLLYGPLIYLYVRQLTSRQNQVVKNQYLHFIPVLMGAVLLAPFFLMDGADKFRLAEAVRKGEPLEYIANDLWLVELSFTVFILGTIVQLGSYLLLSIRLLIKHSETIRNEFSDIQHINLAWLRNLLLGLSCIYLLYLGDQFSPDMFGINFFGDFITVFAVIMIYAMGYIGIRQPAIFSQSSGDRAIEVDTTESQEESKYLRSGLDTETSRMFLKELSSHMETAKPYLEGNLVLPELAQQLGISANYLSQIINEQLEVNFYDFINGYRVDEAKRLIRNAGEEKINVLNIALDSGFNSKSAFYTAFKKATSMTPTEFRKSL